MDFPVDLKVRGSNSLVKDMNPRTTYTRDLFIATLLMTEEWLQMGCKFSSSGFKIRVSFFLTGHLTKAREPNPFYTFTYVRVCKIYGIKGILSRWIQLFSSLMCILKA